MFNHVLVFTDLDGTLLDHHTYSFAPALPMLEKLHNQHIPVIPNTSKTFAELSLIRKEVGLNTPFIVENGAAVYIPKHFFKAQPTDTTNSKDYWIKSFSQPNQHWISLLDKLKEDFSGEFNHFSNMTVNEIQQATGLTTQQAELASSREYGEPVQWLGEESVKALFVQALNEFGANTLQGGRFLHVSGKCDKGKAMLWLKQQFQIQQDNQKYTSIALGDGQNDVAMLDAADIAVRIASPVNAAPILNKQSNVYTSKAYGPQGWAECLEQIIFNDPQLNQ